MLPHKVNTNNLHLYFQKSAMAKISTKKKYCKTDQTTTPPLNQHLLLICLFKKLLFTMENATAADSSQSNISRVYI